MIKEIKCVLTKPVSALRQLRDKINEVIRKVNDIDANGTAGGGSGSGGSFDLSDVIVDINCLINLGDENNSDQAPEIASVDQTADVAFKAFEEGKICRVTASVEFISTDGAVTTPYPMKNISQPNYFFEATEYDDYDAIAFPIDHMRLVLMAMHFHESDNYGWMLQKTD